MRRGRRGTGGSGRRRRCRPRLRWSSASSTSASPPRRRGYASRPQLTRTTLSTAGLLSRTHLGAPRSSQAGETRLVWERRVARGRRLVDGEVAIAVDCPAPERRDISDFWRRWQISLSSWLRDYLFIPLGGSRHGALRTIRNLVITMFLAGCLARRCLDIRRLGAPTLGGFDSPRRRACSCPDDSR
jgi:MBOAT, membrane-bound O-acyltransferase family